MFEADPAPPNFGSVVHDDQFGSFFYRELAVEFPTDDFTPLDSAGIDSILGRHAGAAERGSAAFRDAAFIHELRHFHDCFGTMAGLTLFERHIARLNHFQHVVGELGRHGISWHLPLTEWVKDPSCPSVVKHFVNGERGVQVIADIFMGRLPVVSVEGHTDEAWKDVTVGGLQFPLPFYPFLLMIGPHAAGAAPSLRPVTSWRLIGFEALIEGSAQALQRTWLEQRWPDEVVDEAWKRINSRTEKLASRRSWESIVEKAGSVALPYNLTDFLITKVLRRQGIPTFPRDLVLRTTDKALMGSSILGRSFIESNFNAIAVEMTHPGRTFVDLVDRVSWREPVLECVEHVTNAAALDGICAAYGALPSFDDYGPDIKQANPVEAIRNIVGREIVAPLFRARIEHGDAVYAETGEYLDRALRLPWPPFVVTPSGLRSGWPEVMLEKWYQYGFLSSVVDQLLGGKRILDCPRAHRTIPGIGNLELVATGDCDRRWNLKECGHWIEGMRESLPQCGFSWLLRAIELE